MKDLKPLVRRFYDECLTVSPSKDAAQVAKVMGELLTDDFQSLGTSEVKGKAQLTGQVQFFWKLIPDLVWAPQELLQDGNQVVVRSLASGSPKGEFMGLQLDGSRTFKIMSLDIHTVVEGRITRVHHLEDWTTAIKQLKA